LNHGGRLPDWKRDRSAIGRNNNHRNHDSPNDHATTRAVLSAAGLRAARLLSEHRAGAGVGGALVRVMGE